MCERTLLYSEMKNIYKDEPIVETNTETVAQTILKAEDISGTELASKVGYKSGDRKVKSGLNVGNAKK